MKKILEYILQSEGISNLRLATMLDVAPASITHILSGRNKPSYDFIVKLVEAFPQYDARWLITGKGEPRCLLSQRHESKAYTVKQDPSGLFDFGTGSVDSVQQRAEESVGTKVDDVGEKKCTRLIVCYPDNTFTEYTQR